MLKLLQQSSLLSSLSQSLFKVFFGERDLALLLIYSFCDSIQSQNFNTAIYSHKL